MHRYYGHFTNVTNCVARKSLTVTGAAGRNHHRAGRVELAHRNVQVSQLLSRTSLAQPGASS